MPFTAASGSRVILAILGSCAAIVVLPRVLLLLKAQCADVATPAAAPLGRGSPVCDYGGQPYYFVETTQRTPFNATARAWDLRAFDARCQPQPLVETLVRANSSADKQLAVLVYGDSVDRSMVDSLCDLAGAQRRSHPEPATSKRYRSVTWCSTDRLLLMDSWTNGLHQSRMKAQVQSPEQALNQSRTMFRKLSGRESPDILLVASCMWDVAHWVRNETFFGLRDRSSGAQPYLGEERLKSYVADLTAYIGMLRAGFPATEFVAVHTMPQRNARALLANEDVGGAKRADETLRLAAGHSKQLLWNNYIADVNAALRHVAATEALTLLDYEGIMLRLPTAHAHFRDGFHPLDKLLSTVMFNLLLNEYESSAARGSSRP